MLLDGWSDLYEPATKCEYNNNNNNIVKMKRSR